MRFLKLAVTTYGHDRTRPVIGADDVWINLDQVVSIEEQLDSNTFADAVREGIAPEEHYPCVELTTSNGSTHLVSLGVYPDQASGFAALTRFMPLLLDGIGDDGDEDVQLAKSLEDPPSVTPSDRRREHLASHRIRR
ncbi:hypothetical protein [Cryobacterium sp. PH31-L1]|uniref:hypothetical protein n=1 Tax=Cryobacterium sp. PH31-L1 TaxID=3046199 RepID=UPI0024BA89F3|nr:hypothetical protein [Cryobacterium sp. PH31-L1]MDJ0379149.1 hypothetical protein [Cryobacterium sp. PH31-L1]